MSKRFTVATDDATYTKLLQTAILMQTSQKEVINKSLHMSLAKLQRKAYEKRLGDFNWRTMNTAGIISAARSGHLPAVVELCRRHNQRFVTETQWKPAETPKARIKQIVAWEMDSHPMFTNPGDFEAIS